MNLQLMIPIRGPILGQAQGGAQPVVVAMNWMNINEHVFASCESFCFVAGKTACFSYKYTIFEFRDITNAMATPKKWFINVHLVHRKAILERLFYFLMNLMNFDELTYCLRPSFAMGLKTGLAGWLLGGSPSSSMFMRFIERPGVRGAGPLTSPTLCSLFST